MCGGSDQDKVDLLIKMGKSWSDRPVLFPITDVMVRSIADRLEEMREYYRIGLPSKEIVDQMISKKKFSELVGNSDFPAPRTLFIDHNSNLEEVNRYMKFPCIIKPEYRSIGFLKTGVPKAFIAENSSELIDFYRSFSHGEPHAVIQEWVPGDDGDVYFCLQYYSRRSYLLGSFSGRKIRQWPPLSGGTASCEPVEIETIEALSTNFFQRFNFKGLCSMEFKKHRHTGEFYFIEPTVGRTDWQSDVANVNGIPLPYIAYCDLTDQQIPKNLKIQKRIRWIRWSADYESAKYYINRGELTWIKWIFSLIGPIKWSIWSFTDPKPYLMKILGNLYRKIKRKCRV